MKFSILIPVYNVEKYLYNCLDSVINQTFNDYEVICVDDGSTDTSGKICDKYFDLYPNLIHVIHKKNEGLISARRVGIKNAKGDYYCFLDSDDLVVPRFLEKLNNKIDKYKPDIVIFGYQRINQKGESIKVYPPPIVQGMYSLMEMSKIRDIVVLSDLLNNLCFKCVKAEIFDKNADYSKYYTVKNGEDLIQSLPLFDKALSVYVINDCLYLYRFNGNSLTNKRINIQTIDSWLEMYKVLCKYAKKWGYDEKEYKKRYGLILRGILFGLILFKFNYTFYKNNELIEIIERLIKKDFQKILRAYKPKNIFSIEQALKIILVTRSKFIIIICLLILKYSYKIYKLLIFDYKKKYIANKY